VSLLPSGVDVVEIARRLLGWRLASDVDGAGVEVMITEVEAYGGTDDPASHAFSGPTPRNISMFSGPGTLYVYRSYGIHWCANVVTGGAEIGEAVLLRGAHIISGRDTAAARRGRSDHLTDGPGKLCQALGITGDLDGHDLATGPLRLSRGSLPDGWLIDATRRIGITRAVERPWRFVAMLRP